MEYMTPLDAFRHFLEHVYPDIKSSMSEKQIERIKNARRDSEGRRTKKDGYTYVLSSVRIKDILHEFAPGQYKFEERVTFTANPMP